MLQGDSYEKEQVLCSTHQGWGHDLQETGTEGRELTGCVAHEQFVSSLEEHCSQGKSLAAANVVAFTGRITKFGHPIAGQAAYSLFLDHRKRPAPAEGCSIRAQP